MLQTTALDILKSGANVFLTGSAGAGKTYVINQYIEYLREKGVPLAVTASTGIAATHINGQTIHSWSGLGIKDVITDRDLDKIAKRKVVRQRLEQVKVLIIDEISMLSAKNLEGINQILQFFKISYEPFGGIQVIFSGDFFQLPPVSRERLPNWKKFAFMAPVWVNAELKICYLTEQYRQDESGLLSLLNEIRDGDITDSSQDLLMEKMEDSQHHEDLTAIKLYTHNADVDVVNQEHLEALVGESEDYYGTSTGTKKLVDTLKKSVLANDHIILKINTQVIFIKNNYEVGYLNGTLGTVIEFDKDDWPVIETISGDRIVARPVEWSVVNEFNQPVATYAQIPLRLAWAITVHKSQGMTLDAAIIDLSKTFEPGQGYVALSRVKTWGGLTLLGCNDRALQMDELVMRANARFQELSNENEKGFLALDKSLLTELHETFVQKHGGVKLIPQLPITQKKLSATGLKVSTYDKTKTLISAGKRLDQIVEERALSTGTIIAHIEKLHEECPELDVDKFKPKKAIIKAVELATKVLQKTITKDDLDRAGNIKISLLHKQLKGKYDYDTVRLGRMFAPKVCIK